MAQSLVSSLTVTLKDGVSANAGRAAGSIKDLEKALSGISNRKFAEGLAKDFKSLNDIDAFKGLQRGANNAFKDLQMVSNKADELKKKLADAKLNISSGTQGGVTDKFAKEQIKKLEEQQKSYEASVKRLTALFDKKISAVNRLGSELNLAGMNVKNLAGAEEGLKKSISSTTSAIEVERAAFKRRAQWLKESERAANEAAAANIKLANSIKATSDKAATAAAIQQAHKTTVRNAAVATVAGGASASIAAKLPTFVKKTTELAGDLDYAVRRQRAFTDISEEQQKRVLEPQRKAIARETKFTNTDIVEAQTKVANRLPTEIKTPETIAGIVGSSKNYALAMKGTSMEDAANAITGFLMSAQKDISTPQKANDEALKATNMLIKMSKLGNMDHNDIMPFVQRGMTSGTLAGLSPETMGAMGVGLKRNNIVGEQAGTALRTMAAKFVSPTQKGMAALNASGLNYSDYTTTGGMTPENLEKSLKQRFGKGLSGDSKSGFKDLLEDEDAVGSKENFVESASKLLQKDLVRNTQKGTANLKDQEALSKALGQYYDMSVKSVNTEKLFTDFMKTNPSLALLNALITDKHGGKGGVLAKNFDTFEKDKAELSGVPLDFGDKIAKQITEGLGGEIDKFKGSVEDFKIAIGTANAAWTIPAMKTGGNILDKLGDLPDSAKIGGTVAAGAVGVGGTAYAGYKLMQAVSGMGATTIAMPPHTAAMSAHTAALMKASGLSALTKSPVAGGVSGTSSNVPLAATAIGAVAVPVAVAVLGAAITDRVNSLAGSQDVKDRQINDLKERKDVMKDPLWDLAGSDPMGDFQAGTAVHNADRIKELLDGNNTKLNELIAARKSSEETSAKNKADYNNTPLPQTDAMGNSFGLSEVANSIRTSGEGAATAMRSANDALPTLGTTAGVNVGAGLTAIAPTAGTLFGTSAGAAFNAIAKLPTAGGSMPAGSSPTIAGARASGGPVAGGKTYLVGEKGPELFTPPNSGTIIPNGGSGRAMGGSNGGGGGSSPINIAININNTNNGQKVDVEAIIAKVRAGLNSAVSQSMRGSYSDMGIA